MVQFKDLMFTSITLFALLNGDDIRATFQDLGENYPYPIVPVVYLYTFIAFFITVILNIFISIIEDAYHSAKFVSLALLEQYTQNIKSNITSNFTTHEYSK